MLIIAALIVGTLVSASSASAEKGGQFTGIWEAQVTRRGSPHRRWEFWVYSAGGVCLAGSACLAILVGRSFEVRLVQDYTIMRMAVLALASAGILSLARGAWRIIRGVIIQAEINRREGNAHSLVPPRLLITALPALTGLGLIIFNWLSKSN